MIREISVEELKARRDQGENPLVLAEELNSYLLPSERIDWKNTSGTKKAA